MNGLELMNRLFACAPLLLVSATTGCVSTAGVPSACPEATLPSSEPAALATPVAGRVDPEPQDSPPSGAGADAEAVAKQLANPIAALISVPFQLNYDDDIGPGDGERWTLNVQPVVPISLNEDWNVISRTILPLIDQEDIPAGNDESGIGDVVQSLFFSPVAPTASGWIWGVGPVLLIPTASDPTLGAEQWGSGPTAVVLKQEGPWTYGALVNHIWSFTGDDDRADVNATFMQPFAAYTTPTAMTFTLNSESTYDWEADELALPANAVMSKVVKVGGHLVSVGGGLRYWIEETDASPEGLGFRFFVTLLFPR